MLLYISSNPPSPYNTQPPSRHPSPQIVNVPQAAPPLQTEPSVDPNRRTRPRPRVRSRPRPARSKKSVLGGHLGFRGVLRSGLVSFPFGKIPEDAQASSLHWTFSSLFHSKMSNGVCFKNFSLEKNKTGVSLGGGKRQNFIMEEPFNRVIPFHLLRSNMSTFLSCRFS